MKGTGRKIFGFLLRSLGFFGGFILLYAMAILLLGSIPVNSSFAQSPGGVEIMVIDNGIHTDLVLPAKSKIIDWRKYLHPSDYAGADTNFAFVAFGWGNRRFYMETPEWSDLKLDVALTSALGFGRSAMHVYYLPKRLNPGKTQVPLRLSEEQYGKLVQHILNTFQQNENGSFLLIKGKGYTSTDNFYEAHGRFSIFKTCNSWTNGTLKATGVETVFWAPIPHLMMPRIRKLAGYK
jgi:uncharacterized protein (TIGR02117 family)